jgi:multicomponent Na+:H+ antiporter subunit C
MNQIAEFFQYFFDRYEYYLIFFLFFLSLFAIVIKKDLIRKLIALSIFQTCAILLYLTIGFTEGAKYPILIKEENQISNFDQNKIIYNNPLPHVLMLTAIVVGIATFALGLSIVLAIAKAYNELE